MFDVGQRVQVFIEGHLQKGTIKGVFINSDINQYVVVLLDNSTIIATEKILSIE